jgi:hypothetical protein
VEIREITIKKPNKVPQTFRKTGISQI